MIGTNTIIMTPMTGIMTDIMNINTRARDRYRQAETTLGGLRSPAWGSGRKPRARSGVAGCAHKRTQDNKQNR